jgi:hypothetical protein
VEGGPKNHLKCAYVIYEWSLTKTLRPKVVLLLFTKAKRLELKKAYIFVLQLVKTNGYFFLFLLLRNTKV